jgi:acetyl esterase/lipase
LVGGGALIASLMSAAAVGAPKSPAAGAASDLFANVDPELAAVLKAAPIDASPYDAGNLAARRAGLKPRPILTDPALQPRRAVLPGPHGGVPVLIFDPKPGAQNRPATLYFHGGGFVVGRAETSIRWAQDIVQATDSVVISVDYSVAPEAAFPQALEEGYAALKWLHESSETLGVDRARIAVCGDSAGGGHAAVLAVAARDRGQFPIAFQCLIYPMLDDRTGSTRRVPPHLGQLVWTEASNRFAWTCLLGRPAGSPTQPPGSVPARLENLCGLPPAFIGVGAIDLFCEEGLEYAHRLIRAGVETELLVVPGAYHAFAVIARDARLSAGFHDAWQGALRRGLGLGVKSRLQG